MSHSQEMKDRQQVQDRHEILAKHYVKSVEDLLSKIFHCSAADICQHNTIWRKWNEISAQMLDRLLNLIENTDIDDVYKARAIAVLIAPSVLFTPFARYSDPRSNTNVFLGSALHPLSSLSSELCVFTLELLKLNIDTARNLAKDDPNYLSVESCYLDKYVLWFLAELPADNPLAEQLFNRLSMNDLECFIGEDGSSGYNPFRDIMESSIPDVWKRKADEQTRNIIEAEAAGARKPRMKRERAWPNYVKHIGSLAIGKSIPYPVDLLASQIAYIEKWSNWRDWCSFVRVHVDALLTLLADEKYRRLCIKIVASVVLGEVDGRKFEIAYTSDLNLAKKMLVMCGSGGDLDVCFADEGECVDELRRLITRAEVTLAERNAEIAEAKRKEEIILGKMKKVA